MAPTSTNSIFTLLASLGLMVCTTFMVTKLSGVEICQVFRERQGPRSISRSQGILPVFYFDLILALFSTFSPNFCRDGFLIKPTERKGVNIGGHRLNEEVLPDLNLSDLAVTVEVGVEVSTLHCMSRVVELVLLKNTHELNSLL